MHRVVDRWTVVDEQAAIACAGSDARVFPTDLATYVVGSAALVILLEPGDRPGGTGVNDFARVTLHPPIPPAASAYLAADRRTVPFVLGFVRLPQGYLALGPMHVGMRRFDHLPEDWDPFDRGPVPGAVIEAGLSLAERLPFDLLDQVRPTHGGPTPSLDWLALLPADPIRALAAFVDGWFADLSPAVEPAGPPVVAVPEVLAAFYRAVAGRCEILGYHNRIHHPVALRRDAQTGLVEFGVECQGGFWLLMDPTDPDPPVVYGGLADGLVTEREPLSGYLLQFLLLEQAHAAPFRAEAELDQAQVQRLVAPLHPVPLRPMRWPCDPTHLYAGPGVVAMVAVNTDDSPWAAAGTAWVSIGSRSRGALAPFREPGFAWSTFNG